MTPFGLTLSASVAKPLSLTFTLPSATCPTITNGGYTQFQVTDPSPVPTGVSTMCTTFKVPCPAGGVPNVTVAVSASDGGTPLASGVTNAAGVASLSWQGLPGQYYVSLTGLDPRFAPFFIFVAASTRLRRHRFAGRPTGDRVRIHSLLLSPS